MISVSGDYSLSSYQNINWFLVYVRIEPKSFYSTKNHRPQLKGHDTYLESLPFLFNPSNNMGTFFWFFLVFPLNIQDAYSLEEVQST